MKELFKTFEGYPGLAPEFFVRLQELAQTIELAPQQHLLAPGENVEGTYFLEKGFLWCYMDTARVAKWYMDKPGLVRTDLAYEEGSGHNEKIQALEHSVVSCINGSALRQLISEFPEFERVVVGWMGKSMGVNN